MEHIQTPLLIGVESDRDILMKQYHLLVDSYLKYLDYTLKFTFFSYAVTGAILSYYLSKPAEGFMKYALAFPILVNLVFGVSFFLAAWWNKPIFEELKRVTKLLDLGAFPDSSFLSRVLQIFGGLFFVVTFVLIVLSLYRVWRHV